MEIEKAYDVYKLARYYNFKEIKQRTIIETATYYKKNDIIITYHKFVNTISVYRACNAHDDSVLVSVNIQAFDYCLRNKKRMALLNKCIKTCDTFDAWINEEEKEKIRHALDKLSELALA